MPLIEPKSTVHFAEVDGEGTLLDLERGRYLALNRTATRIWQVLVRAATLGEAVAALRPHLAADDATLRDAARDLIEQARAAGLVENLDHGATRAS